MFFSYLTLFIAAMMVHLFFLIGKNYLSEACCDSFTQLSHYYPFLQHTYGQGNFFWSWEEGLGGDVFSEYLYYYSTNPFFWLTMPFDLSSLQSTIEMRLFLSIGKVFLAMILLFHFLRYLKRSYTAAVTGACIYGGSYYFLIFSLRFDFMVDGMVWLPLVIWGYERLVQENKKSLFVLSIFLIISSNFYLSYISSIFLVLYACMKYFQLHQSFRWKSLIKHYLQLAGYYLIGLGLAAFAFLPAVDRYLHVDRFYAHVNIPLLFDAPFYKNLVKNLFLMTGKEDFVVIFPILVLILVLYGFQMRSAAGKYHFRFCLFIAFLVMIPFVYSLFNGFSFMEYRWLYLFVFSVAVASAFLLDDLLKRGHRLAMPIQLLIIIIFTYITYTKMKKWKHFSGDQHVLEALLFSWVAIIVYLLLFYLKDRISKKWVASGIVLILVVNIGLTNDVAMHFFAGDPELLDKKLDQRLAWYGQAKDQQMFQSLQNDDRQFYRITLMNRINEINEGLLYHFKGFGLYNSLLSGDIHRFFKNEYNILQVNIPSQVNKLDNRLFLMSGLANKYYVIHKDKSFRPYDYSLFRTAGDYTIWKNNHPLSIGFLYPSVTDYRTFHQLNASERDQLFLSAAVVDHPEKFSLPKFQPKVLQVERIPYHQIKLEKSNASLKGNRLKIEENGKLWIENPFYQRAGELIVTFKMSKWKYKRYRMELGDKVFNHFKGKYNYPKEEISIHLGETKDWKRIPLKLSPGLYQVRDLTLTFQTYQTYHELVQQRQQDELKQVKMGKNGYLTAKITAKTKGLLFLSIPYSDGWKIKVDGKEQKALKVNTAFLGVPIERGTHQIELAYRTPYLYMGITISVITLICWRGILLYRRRNRVKSK
ncbi:Uncharacterized membrane protein YfhO [Seinonella peptonophila]|uniref:Uncharacterized membrane protein YfhO n=1 Tax=Seinonella peptonophila TaxID=112248 RepID=A0A1M4XA27_9BACL|nr:YfhO family protein [Seinonella peptonophila]SHE90334.1 Uncharacterized membrane protein YfhO [Seinonella peptonophila]